MGCRAVFSLREALHEVELSSTFRNGLQQLTTPLHSSLRSWRSCEKEANSVSGAMLNKFKSKRKIGGKVPSPHPSPSNFSLTFEFVQHGARNRIRLLLTRPPAMQAIAQCITPPATCLAILRQFYGSFNKGACAHYLFFVPRSIARQVAEKTAQCNRALTPNLGNLQRYIFNHCETSC